jgi:hypothetical protein
MTKENQELIEKIGQKIENETKKIEGEFEMHTKALAEQFQKNVGAVAEQYSSLQEKVGATFELAGEMKQDIEIMKADIGFIKSGLKQKVDMDEFEALEKRVILLERKLKGA